MELAPDPGGETSLTDSGEGSEGAGENHVEETEAEAEMDLRRTNAKIAELGGEVSLCLWTCPGEWKPQMLAGLLMLQWHR
jgi:hypothetical protein